MLLQIDVSEWPGTRVDADDMASDIEDYIYCGLRDEWGRAAKRCTVRTVTECEVAVGWLEGHDITSTWLTKLGRRIPETLEADAMKLLKLASALAEEAPGG